MMYGKEEEEITIESHKCVKENKGKDGSKPEI